VTSGSPSTITVNVTVNSSAPPQVTNEVTVAGGGSVGSSAIDLTTVASPTPVLEISITHAGNLYPGDNAIYTVNVGNQFAAPTTSGTVTVSQVLSSGLTPVSLTGTGWSCGANSCSRNDGLSGGSAYPPITATVAVGATPPLQVTNTVTASGGGSATSPSATDTATVPEFTCSLNGSLNVADVQTMIYETLGIYAPYHDLNHDGTVNILDVQKEINVVLGQTCAY
jgi:uncharacterized repeat protein (TIGR01451 family)